MLFISMYFDKQIGTKNFWIDKAGKIYKCGGHEKFAKQMLPASTNALADLYKSGFVKVVVEVDFDMYVHYAHNTATTPGQQRSLNLISNEYGFGGSYREIPEVVSEQVLKYKDFYK